MLITARTYSASQTPDQGAPQPCHKRSRFHTFSGWQTNPVDTKEATDMLLIHQVGSVRVGEVVRYTITYSPAADPILPIPSNLYVRVKNTSAIPLRAAYLHGPYTLYAACYPSHFDPNTKYERQDLDGTPQFEPYLKAGGGWDAVIKVPANLLEAHDFGSPGQGGPASGQSVSWIVEIQSQVIFSTSAAVHFELLVSRDEKSLEFFSGGAWNSGNGSPGPPAKLQDHWLPETRGSQVLASNGVYSRAIALHVDDTTSLWSSPPFPSAKPASKSVDRKSQNSQLLCENAVPEDSTEAPMKRAKKKVHLVLLTHGLHSNLGADMLYLKESIDAAIRKSKNKDSHVRAPNVSPVDQENPTSKSSHVEQEQNSQSGDDPDDDDEEQVIVRGFSGNAVRTERGIQYLGKRLAKYVLLLTYPDQPYFPLKGSKSNPFSRPFSARKERAQPFSHSAESTPQENAQEFQNEDHAYQITSISFVGHSLGGLIQTYAIAYIQKHSPQFFEQIRPVNFIALATPFLGLSNENPMYVRFALDLGLVGRTGQDLGLSWTAPKVRSGWGAIIAGRGESAKDPGHSDPGSKPLLRILPCGPAYEVLKKFQHRTVYSNVVNDGIVPLRTSSLLFLDWKGLDRVEKARRDNGLVGTMAEWGWAELTGANSKSPRFARPDGEPPLSLPTMKTGHRNAYSATEVPVRPKDDQLDEDTISPTSGQFLALPSHVSNQRIPEEGVLKENLSRSAPSSPLDSFFSLFRLNQGKNPPNSKHAKIYKRSQTLRTFETGDGDGTMPIPHGHSSHEHEGVYTPPKTTFFESAGDLLMPPLPPADFILDPASRPRTIFHDRIYHPGDIPPPLPAKRRTIAFGSLQGKQSKSAPTQDPPASIADNESGLKVEEKIARAYHRDLTWRKVLVRLEPDAHNNIIVRRMFTNAYGWPVVKHLVDTHFRHTATAEINDSLKQNVELAKSPNVGPTSSGDEVEEQSESVDPKSVRKTDDLPIVSDLHVSEDISSDPTDSLPAEDESHIGTNDRSLVSRQDSARWTDREVVEDDSESGFEVETHAGFRHI
ncbi:unnamed protein product [Penicillium egyptiacum]|uniref:DUF676 domain-containing protein n=1 Tax=Penicillium egyptiacum TaxID=1303716 RepID=A0A9W4P4Z7_9EURO|nr:unnamed protein product [Penicillium egyptiacum]